MQEKEEKVGWPHLPVYAAAGDNTFIASVYWSDFQVNFGLVTPEAAATKCTKQRKLLAALIYW